MGRARSDAIARGAVVALVALLAASIADGQRLGPAEPRPQDAIIAILSALDAHPLVAIGEVHRNQQVHDLIASLVRDARFLPNGGDIVVEFGNARYQDQMDRYVAGEVVDSNTLAHVWRDAVNILVWDAPVYERFFDTVREVNRARSTRNRLRVVLADPAMDWTAIHDRASWEQIVAVRDQHSVEVIDREVLAHRRRALLIFGSGHVQHEAAFGPYSSPGRPRVPNLAELLDAEHPGDTFYITADWMRSQLDARLGRWRPPVVIPLRGTWLGAAHVGPASQTPSLEALADAFLYLGPTSSLTTSVPAPEIYADTTYLRELLRRDALQGGANSAELRRLSARFLNERRP
jgi:hypothetical protein